MLLYCLQRLKPLVMVLSLSLFFAIAQGLNRRIDIVCSYCLQWLKPLVNSKKKYPSRDYAPKGYLLKKIILNRFLSRFCSSSSSCSIKKLCNGGHFAFISRCFGTGFVFAEIVVCKCSLIVVIVMQDFIIVQSVD
jgi:hypothetical protein